MSEAASAAQPLVRIATGDAPHGDSRDDALAVRVGPGGPPDGAAAQIAVRIADPALAATITERIAAAITAAAAELAAAAPQGERAVTLRSRKALARRAAEIAGAVTVVPVTERNARHLVELVGGIRAAGALGVQLVWDGEAPPRERVERHVFAVLEQARATPLGPPVVLATEARPAAALWILIAHGRRTER